MIYTPGRFYRTVKLRLVHAIDLYKVQSCHHAERNNYYNLGRLTRNPQANKHYALKISSHLNHSFFKHVLNLIAGFCLI